MRRLIDTNVARIDAGELLVSNTDWQPALASPGHATERDSSRAVPA
ncbi:hypothetical protein [Halomonas urumqiensis]|nr:hypothetical protein [Halomonas urumqiensis]